MSQKFRLFFPLNNFVDFDSRICLARALYRQELTSGILILDEGTSKLDAFTEELILAAVFRRRNDSKATALMVSHRLKNFQQCDMIMILKDGNICQQGLHEELMKDSNGWYAKAWNLQQNDNI